MQSAALQETQRGKDSKWLLGGWLRACASLQPAGQVHQNGSMNMLLEVQEALGFKPLLVSSLLKEEKLLQSSQNTGRKS